MQASPSSAPAAPAAARRDPWRDNARLGLIVLVIFGHCLEAIGGDSPLLATLYRFVYLFHMPAFAFLSGSVAHAEIDLRQLHRVAFRLLLPYLLFQGLYALAARAPGWPDDGPAGVATPYWLLWYLPSLAAWRVLLPLWVRLRHPVLLAVLGAVAAGWSPDVGYRLSLSRTVVLFPLFLLGWRYGEAWRARLQGGAVRAAALAALAGLLLVAATGLSDPRWLYGSVGYAALGADPLAGAAQRAALVGLGVLGTAAFLAWTPHREMRWSGCGARSLQAYLVHGFLVKFGEAAGIFAALSMALSPAPLAAALLVLATALAVILGSRPVARLLGPVTRPAWLEDWLWHGRRAGQPRA